MLEELQLEEAAETSEAAAAPAPRPAPAPTPEREAPEAVPLPQNTPAPTAPSIPGISSLAGNREGSWQRGEKRKREEDGEGPVERRARGEMREDSLARRREAWQAERAAINSRAARDTRATYLAERADIRRRLQRQELEVQRLREEMAAKERERDARRRNTNTPGPLPVATGAASSSAPLPPPAASAHPETPPIPSTTNSLHFSTSHLPSRYLAHPRPHGPTPAAGASHPPSHPHGRGAPPPALPHARRAQPYEGQRGRRT